MGKGNKAKNTNSRGGNCRGDRSGKPSGSSTQDVQRRNGDFDEENEGDDDVEVDEEDLSDVKRSDSLACRVYLWEFGQNDSKRDSGSKMVRLGYAKQLRIGQSFPGVVLSSEAKTFVSPEDTELVEKNGVAGINCSWNRLDEIPFGSMGKGRNQRLLPFLVAANTVNYGKPFKMNTAEATAACLYITGFKADAQEILEPFSYGAEFIRLNFEALEAYASARTMLDVKALNDAYLAMAEENRRAKELKKEANRFGPAASGGYMDDMDLPPMGDDEEEEEDDEEEVLEGVVDGGKQGGVQKERQKESPVAPPSPLREEGLGEEYEVVSAFAFAEGADSTSEAASTELR